MRRALTIILGGTFDPVHCGHLRCALEVSEWAAEPVRMLLSPRPAHRPAPVAPAADRWRLLVAACEGHPALLPDDRELRRPGATYSVHTLGRLREAQPEAAIAFVVGADAFAGLAQWRDWRRVLELTHFIVVHRPGTELRPPDALRDWWCRGLRERAEDLRAAPAGLVARCEITPLDISASAIRQLLAESRDPAFLLPETVRRAILAQGLYGAG